MKYISLNRSILFLIVFLSSYITEAGSIITLKAEFAIKNPTHIWNWSEIAATGNDPDMVLVGDFTLVDQLDANTFIIPYQLASYKTKKVQSNQLGYLKLNCKTRSAFLVSGFKNGTFESIEELKKNSTGYAAIQTVCGTENYRGILKAAFFNMENRQYVGWVDTELTESDTNPGLVKIVLYNYLLLNDGEATTGTTFAGSFDIDCNRRVLLETLSNKQIKIHDPLDPKTNYNFLRYQHVINHACEYYKNKVSQFKAKENINIENKSQISISEAKDKCKTLGFKTGTEKFGTCVLELTK